MPSKEVLFSIHIDLIILKDSSNCLILVIFDGKLYPYAMYSSSYQPAPIPNSILPLLIISNVDIIFDKSAGLRYELHVTICPIFIFVVIAAMADNNVKHSKMFFSMSS